MTTVSTVLSDCPNKCGTRVGRRKESVDRHRRLCRLEPMECPFNEVGCPAGPPMLSRQNYSEHMSSNLELHLKLVMDKHESSTGMREPVVSPLEKLGSIAAEVSILEGFLGRQVTIPALECIKTHLRQPDLQLRRDGDCCTFRMRQFTRYCESGDDWFSPPFYYYEGIKMCLSVHVQVGNESIKEAYLTVSLHRVKEESSGRLKTVSLLQCTGGIEVALLHNPTAATAEKRSQSFTWTPGKEGKRGMNGVSGAQAEKYVHELLWCEMKFVSLAVVEEEVKEQDSLVFQVRWIA